MQDGSLQPQPFLFFSYEKPQNLQLALASGEE